MIAEFLMHYFYWEAVWYPGRNDPHSQRGSWHSFLTQKTCYVGTWTGPDYDLLCVKPCGDREEAERFLSPAGYTILDAAVRAYWKLRREPVSWCKVELHRVGRE